MFTYVPGHGNTPQWLPPSMAVHHGDWKFIRTFHYGKNGKHQYRLYNLRDDIGENHNVIRNHPERVKEMDQWITDYLVEANVVVPLPTPTFDPDKFDPATIGVLKGGLKMHLLIGSWLQQRLKRFQNNLLNNSLLVELWFFL